MLEAASTLGLDIVGGVYRKKPLHLKDLDWKAIAQAAKSGVAPELLQFVEQDLAFAFLPEDIDHERGYVGPTKTSYGRKLVRVSHCGTGFLACTRAALETMLPHAEACKGGMHALFTDGVVDGLFNGEDRRFCSLARQVGLTAWLDTETSINHYGPIGVTGDLRGERLDEYAKKQARK